MSRLVNFFKTLLKRSNESIVAVRSKGGPAGVFTKLPAIVVDGPKIMVDSPIDETVIVPDKHTSG